MASLSPVVECSRPGELTAALKANTANFASAPALPKLRASSSSPLTCNKRPRKVMCGPSFDSRHTYPPNRRSLDCNCESLKVRYGRHSRHLLVSGSSIPHCMPPRRTRHLTQHRRTCPMFSLSHRRMRSSLTLPCLKSFIVYCDCHRTRLPKDLATSSAWVLGARALAPWLHRTLHDLTQVPTIWKDAWMGLLPKTTHPTKPKELRPLGITEISGRAVAGLVQNELRPYLMALVADVPQFAYAPGRSTDAALARVLEHCCSTAALCEPGKYSILDPKFRTAAPTHFTGGGLQLSLDLSHAFDLLPWGLLVRSLRLAQAPSRLQRLIILWHHNLNYHLAIQGQTSKALSIPCCRCLPPSPCPPHHATIYNNLFYKPND